jgi:protein TonB
MHVQEHYTNGFIEGAPEPLSTAVRRGLLALIIFFHIGFGWALTQFEPAKLIVGDIAAMEVRMVPADKPSQPEAQQEDQPPEPPEPPRPDPPLAEEPPPPEMPLTDLASVLDPPPPDLPPPAFPIEAKPPPPPPEPAKPKPPAPKPTQRQPAAPVDVAPQQAAPAVAAAPRTVQASQLGFLVPPNPAYPALSRRAGQQGAVMVRVLVDIAGRPSQVSLHTSSGHAPLDESALSAVRASQFRPYTEGGIAQAVWVLVPIRFVLQ